MFLNVSLRGWEAITFHCIESINLCLVEIHVIVSVLTDLSGVNFPMMCFWCGLGLITPYYSEAVTCNATHAM